MRWFETFLREGMKKPDNFHVTSVIEVVGWDIGR